MNVSSTLPPSPDPSREGRGTGPAIGHVDPANIVKIHSASVGTALSPDSAAKSSGNGRGTEPAIGHVDLANGVRIHSVRELTQRRIELRQHTILDGEFSDPDFLALAGECAKQPDSVVLLSGGQPVEGESRYSIAGWSPIFSFESKGRRCRLHSPGYSISVESDPLDILDEVSGKFSPDFPLVVPPFSGGAMGYFSYDLKNTIERLPQTAVDDLGLPDIRLIWPGRILVHDRLEKRVHQIELRASREGEGGGFPPSIPLVKTKEQGQGQRRNRSTPGQDSGDQGRRIGSLSSNFSREDYLRAVGRVREYIRQGDVYQVNLSQRFQFPFGGDPFHLWKSLFGRNPAPFYAFVNAGEHQVLSTSMERLVHSREGMIETRPIKGTRRRGATREEDEALARELCGSPKDDAELSMIVDLLRNDLGRVCKPRTIRVQEHKRLESYQNVHHLVSIVTGELRPEVSYGSLLRAIFPGGSITGCPKIRSMEIIDELEPNVRHVYTGSIGYLGWHGNLDLNIAIRTGILSRGTCYFSVGGGIVYDSKEEDEYQETLDKGQTLFQLIGKTTHAK